MFGSFAMKALSSPVLADLTTLGMPEAKSTFADMIDWDYAFINIVNAVFFIPITFLLFYLVWRYKKAPGEKAESDISHHTPLEVTWSVVPMILVVIMFAIGLRGYNRMIAAPTDSYTIQVRAQQWSWDFTYPDGVNISGDSGEFNEDKTRRVKTDEKTGLHLPPGTPIRFLMTSADVLHAFFIPEFRIKQDIVPGKISSLWVEPIPPEGDQIDEYWMLCTEYCGTSHSEMITTVYVHPTWESFNNWKAKALEFPEELPWEDRGKILYTRKGCKQCHSAEPGAPAGIGPSWVGLWGSSAEEHLVKDSKDGEPYGLAVLGDAGRDYLTESIRDPNAAYSVGYRDGAMPMTRISDEEILYLIAYIESLGKGQ